jgi:AI-2 transport protein TqsA
VASFLGTAFVVMILTVFMLTEARMFGRRLNAICEARGPNIQRMLTATQGIQRYLGIKTAVSLGTGFLAGFLCWAAGLDFFLLWGIVAFALNYIPVVGSIIAGIPPMILAFLAVGWPSAVAVGIGYIAINIFLGNFVEPMLMGRRFGLSTLVIIGSVFFWGWVWGPVGMLLAVPLMMLLKVVLDNSYEFRWLSVAISKEDRKSHDDEALIKEAVEIAEGIELPEGAATEGSSSS